MQVSSHASPRDPTVLDFVHFLPSSFLVSFSFFSSHQEALGANDRANSLKLKRPQAAKKYRAEIDAMYAEINSAPAPGSAKL